MTDAYYPEHDAALMATSPRTVPDRGPFPPAPAMSVDRSFAYRAACAAEGVAFTDRDGNHVLDGTHGNGVRHACAGHWTLAGQNAAGHDVYTCGVASHRYVAMHRSAGHKCLSVLDCASGTVATGTEA